MRTTVFFHKKGKCHMKLIKYTIVLIAIITHISYAMEQEKNEQSAAHALALNRMTQDQTANLQKKDDQISNLKNKLSSCLLYTSRCV